MKLHRFIYLMTGCILLQNAGCKPAQPAASQPAGCRRVVTLSPSLSETMYALGLGDRVIGVTAFARYPEEVKSKTKIGGYSDINVEAVYALKPDLVLALTQQEDKIRQLRALGLNVAEFRNDTLEDILAMIRETGKLFDRTGEADAICRAIEIERENIIRIARGKPQQKVLISVGRNMGTGQIGDVYAAGPNTLFGEIIEMAGAVNVYDGKAPYAALGREAILRLNPDVIIDLIPDMDKMVDFTKAEALRQWTEYDRLNAVRTGRVTINMASYICIPGPRIVLMMRDIARCIHPDSEPVKTL